MTETAGPFFTSGFGYYSGSAPSSATTYNAYDDMGRVTRKTVTIDGVEYAFTYAYDDAGNLTRIEHPDGYAVNYSYHNNSNLIATVWADGPYVEVDISGYNNFGKPGRIAYPAFDTLIDYYPRTGRVKGIDVPGLMSLDYQYSDAGDVLSIHDAVRNFAYTYTYDNLHRLKTESASGPFRLAESRDIRLYYEGTETHAVSRVVTHRGERNLIYEDNGNMTIGYDFSRPGGFPERRIDYNAENMPLSIDYEPEGGPVSTVNLTYDGDGRRVKKQAGANTVIYVDNTYEIRNGQPVKYIFAGNMRVAKVTGGMVHYYHKDHLGSSAIVTDTSGAMMDSLVYEAYGRPRPTCAPNSGDMAYTYTDQEWDGETGLYNYDARLYDPVLGRFISADSVIPNYYDPQAFDRFAYARNNPMVYVDPDGHSFLDAIPSTIAAGVGYAGIGIAYAGTESAVLIIRVVDKQAAVQARKDINNAFKSVLKIQTGITAAAATGDAIGMGVGALSAKMLSKPSTSGAEAVGDIAANSLPTPTVTNPKLKNLVDDLYKGAKGSNTIGTGSTADAVRNELKTGLPTHGRFHSQKAQEYSNALNKWIKKNQNASDYDKMAARSLLNDLQSALGGN